MYKQASELNFGKMFGNKNVKLLWYVVTAFNHLHKEKII